MSPKPGRLDSLRVRVRRLQFIVGLGFLALVLGTWLTNGLTMRLEPRLQELPAVLLPLVAGVLRNLWALGVLPLLCYGAARIFDLQPLSTALGAVATGASFVLALVLVSGGLEAMFPRWDFLVLHGGMLAAGVLLSHRAVLKGRAEAARAAAQAQAQAQARKEEYQEFLREAERAAEKTAQREAERAAAAGGQALVAPGDTKPPSAGS